jgi:integrase
MSVNASGGSDDGDAEPRAWHGGVDERPDGRLVARIMIEGKRHAHYVKTRQEGYSWLARMRRDHELGITVITERQTVERFLGTWLEMIKPTIRATTLKQYEELTRLHVLPTLGKTQLAKLSPQHLYARKLGEGLSPTTVRHIHVALHRVLKEAMRMGLVQRNVADLTSPPRKARYEVTALTVDQLKTFLSAAQGDRLEALYMLVMSTGMRSGEALALHWRDVDLTCGTLQVRSSLHKLDGQFVFSEPKSARSRRQVTLTALAVAALSAHRRRQLEERLALGDGSAFRELKKE